MKILMFAVLTGCLTIVAEEIKMIAAPPWQNGESPGMYEIYFDGDGVSGSDAKLSVELPVKPQTYYRLSWNAKSDLGDTPFLLSKIRFGNDVLTDKSRVGNDWTKNKIYFYNDSAAVVSLVFSVCGDDDAYVAIKEFDLEPLTPELLKQNVVLASKFENGAAFAEFWKNNYSGDTAFINDPANHWLDGNSGIQLFYLPVVPGKDYTVSFWVKANYNLNMTAIVNLRPPGDLHSGKHYYVSKLFHLASEWKHREITFSVPKDFAEYPDLKSHMVQLVFIADDWLYSNIRFEHIQFRRW